jgi:hypothetical protein
VTPSRHRAIRLVAVAGAAVGCWLSLAATAWAAPSAPFHECPAIGDDSSCQLLIYINDSGVQVLSDGSQGPYEGDEDTLIGVLNDTTGTTIGSLPITGSSSPAIFAFDGDGICVTPNPTSGLPGIDCSSNPSASTGYEGLNSSFSNISGSKQSGTVNFNTPLGPGDSTFFSLEGPISASSLTIISATSASISAVEGASFSGTVATLHSTASEPSSNFSATIAWGDGTTSSGTVSGSGGTYDVSGTHTYVDEGSDTVTVTITDSSNGQTVSVKSTATVADALLTAGTLTASGGVEGSLAGHATFTFTDANPLATAADFTASCDWGDGSSPSSGTVTGSGSGPYSVDCGGHTYAEEGSFTVTVNVTDDGGQTTSASNSVTVADAPLSSTCAAAAVTPQAFSGDTATFTDADANGIGTDYTATINWGDGSSPTSGTIAGGPGTGPYTVTGSHTYSSTGPFTIITTINDAGGSTTSVSCSTLVFAFAPGQGAFVIGDNSSGLGNAVTFWGASWWKLNSLSGGTAPAAFKGFARNPATPACGTNWSTGPGNSAPPPAGPLPAYMGVIVSSSISKTGSIISGDTAHIVIVKTKPGYGPAPGHAGRGTVVAQLC